MIVYLLFSTPMLMADSINWLCHSLLVSSKVDNNLFQHDFLGLHYQTIKFHVAQKSFIILDL